MTVQTDLIIPPYGTFIVADTGAADFKVFDFDDQGDVAPLFVITDLGSSAAVWDVHYVANADTLYAAGTNGEVQVYEDFKDSMGQAGPDRTIIVSDGGIKVGVNLHGVFHMCQAVLPDMLGTGWGRIVNISSSSTHSGVPYMSHCVSAKSGVNGLTKTLALEFGPAGVTVNAVPPGFIDTPMLRQAADKGYLGDIDKSIEATPVRRIGRPEDIAAAVAFLASEEAGYITGQILGVNGGRNT